MSGVSKFPARTVSDIVDMARQHGAILRMTVLANGGIEVGWHFFKEHKAVSDFIAETVIAAPQEWKAEYLVTVAQLCRVDDYLKIERGTTILCEFDRVSVLR